MKTNTTTPKRDKIILGDFETWVEYNQHLCNVALFGFETSKHGVHFDVMGIDGHKHVNGFISIGVRLTKQERTELDSYINKNHIYETRDNNKRI
jgi:hypothetical protein